MSMFIGEALDGDGNEIAHIDLIIGSKDGPAGIAFANALARQSEGHSNLLAVLEPNLAVKPATVMVTKVTIKGAKQAVQMFGPAQAAVAQGRSRFGCRWRDSKGRLRGLPVHRLRRVHSLGSRRQSKDLPVQLQRDKTGDCERYARQAVGRRNGCSQG